MKGGRRLLSTDSDSNRNYMSEYIYGEREDRGLKTDGGGTVNSQHRTTNYEP